MSEVKPETKNERCPTCGKPVKSIFDHVDRDGAGCAPPLPEPPDHLDDPIICVATLESEHYTWTAVGRDAGEAVARLVRRWNEAPETTKVDAEELLGNYDVQFQFFCLDDDDNGIRR